MYHATVVNFGICPNRRKNICSCEICLLATILSKTQHQLHNSFFRGCCNHDYWNVCSHLRLYSLPSCILLGGCSNHGNRSLQKRAVKSKEVPQRGPYIENSKKPTGQRDQTFRKPLKHTPGTHSWTPLIPTLLQTPVTLRTHHSTHHWVCVSSCWKWLIHKWQKKVHNNLQPWYSKQQAMTEMSNFGVFSPC